MVFLADRSHQLGMKRISRKATGGFNLIPCHPVNSQLSEDLCSSLKNKNLAGPKDVYVFYELPVARAPKLLMMYVSRYLQSTYCY